MHLAACDRLGDYSDGARFARELQSGAYEPDVEFTDSWQAALWMAERYRTALSVGHELDLDEVMVAWQSRIERSALTASAVTVTVAGRVLTIVPEPLPSALISAWPHSGAAVG